MGATTQGLREEMVTTTRTLREEIAASAEETRRYTGVLIESVRTDVRAVAEGVMAVDEKLERFRVEVRDEFGRVDRRLLRLETRVSAFENR
ncbi:MAG TPA: hypothetical protein VFN71_01430 [Methylomirabilota bacterium]|nr:hypothetical protein [Methylomirabilota bacterium]